MPDLMAVWPELAQAGQSLELRRQGLSVCECICMCMSVPVHVLMSVCEYVSLSE